MTKDQLLEALLLERYGPPPLPDAAPPHPVERALAARAAAPPPVRRPHLVVLAGGAIEPRRLEPPAQHTIGALMQISLSEDDVLTLAAVDQARVHHDPRYTSGPDYVQDAAQPWLHKRATRRLSPLKRAQLVELDPNAEPDKNGVRPYKLTDLGTQVLAEARAQEAIAKSQSEAS